MNLKALTNMASNQGENQSGDVIEDVMESFLNLDEILDGVGTCIAPALLIREDS
jgi:hypothetical protein